jgi:PAS domain S-box-containing protein
VSEPVAALEQEAVDETVPESVREVAQEPVGEPLPESAGQTVPQPLREPIPVQAGEIDEYLAVFEAIGDGVIVSDPMGRVQLVNKAAERILGRTRGELRGQPIGTIYGQIDSGESIENLAVAFSRRNQPLPTFIENEGQAIQGRLIPWRNEQREWMGIIGVFRDVTREVKADQARDDFVIAVSRELRARLTTVKGYAELITEGVIGEYSPEQLRIQRLILSSAEQMVEVLDNAIQIIAEDSRRTLAHFEEVDVTKIINEALREINPLAQVRELKLIREIRTELPPIVADRRHLRQILDNLLSNACRFTPKGGRVTLRAWTTPEPDNNLPYPHIILSVADNGVGIPKTELERIFSPFYQLENKELGEESGMGMGLAVVKESVGLHNGRVWVESTEGVGSIFQVALPISQEY